MTAKQISQIMLFINNTDIEEDEKTELMEVILDYSQKNNKNIKTYGSNCGKINSNQIIKPKGKEILSNDLLSKKEEQMFIQIPGASVGKTPRKDGRYQGYVLKKDGSKKYFYGFTRKEVQAKIQYSMSLSKDRFIQQQENPYIIQDASFLDYFYNNSNLAKMYDLNKSTQNFLNLEVPKEVHPFREYYENWMENYKKPNLKIKSYECTKNSMKKAVEKFGDTPIEEITSDDIQNLLTSFTAERVRDICKINLSQLFKKAVAQGIIDRNPCDAVEIKKHKEQHKKALTLAEQDKFLAVTKNTPHSLLFRLMLSTGLRIGEALALTKSDIDFENSKLRVNKNVVFVKNKRIVQDTPKSEAGNRTIPIPKDICEELKQVKGEVLFPVTYNAVKLWINKMCAREDMKMTLHTLRHTYATRLEEAGIPAKVKQYLLGHSSLEMTQNTYTDTQEHYIDSLSDKVRAVF